MNTEELSLISADLVQTLSQRGDLCAFGRGEEVIREGDRSDALYILVSGELKVFTADGKGRELVYNILKPGECFGEMFLDGGTRSASVRATEASQCIRVGEEQFRCFMAAYPEFAECLVVKLIGRLRRATQQLRRMAMNDVHERTIELIQAESVEIDGIRVLPRSITQQEIANRIGATREMVNHVIRKLIRSGHLARSKDRRLVVLPNSSADS